MSCGGGYSSCGGAGYWVGNFGCGGGYQHSSCGGEVNYCRYPKHYFSSCGGGSAIGSCGWGSRYYDSSSSCGGGGC